MRLVLVYSLVAVEVLLLVVGLFSYLVLLGLIESRLAANLLQERYGLENDPVVEVSSLRYAGPCGAFSTVQG